MVDFQASRLGNIMTQFANAVAAALTHNLTLNIEPVRGLKGSLWHVGAAAERDARPFASLVFNGTFSRNCTPDVAEIHARIVSHAVTQKVTAPLAYIGWGECWIYHWDWLWILVPQLEADDDTTSAADAFLSTVRSQYPSAALVAFHLRMGDKVRTRVVASHARVSQLRTAMAAGKDATGARPALHHRVQPSSPLSPPQRVGRRCRLRLAHAALSAHRHDHRSGRRSLHPFDWHIRLLDCTVYSRIRLHTHTLAFTPKTFHISTFFHHISTFSMMFMPPLYCRSAQGGD